MNVDYLNVTLLLKVCKLLLAHSELKATTAFKELLGTNLD